MHLDWNPFVFLEPSPYWTVEKPSLGKAHLLKAVPQPSSSDLDQIRRTHPFQFLISSKTVVVPASLLCHGNMPVLDSGRTGREPAWVMSSSPTLLPQGLWTFPGLFHLTPNQEQPTWKLLQRYLGRVTHSSTLGTGSDIPSLYPKLPDYFHCSHRLLTPKHWETPEFRVIFLNLLF